MTEDIMTDIEKETALVAAALAAVMDEGRELRDDEVYALAELETAEGRKALRDGAERITRAFTKPVFDSCSIVNARSGKCSENCKWCAQSGHFKTGCHSYDIIDRDECLEAAAANAEAGIRRFSLVASGRAVKGRALTAMCSMLREAKERTGIFTCASLGLLGREELQELWDAGVRRYHCNLETAPSHFGTLCTTHTIEDKLRTIEAAREIGFSVCSGGILGMGESRRQRAEFALTLRRAQPHSIPLNILSPIPGTPLESTPLLGEDEFIDAVALFRFVHPHTELRFAGGRARLSRAAQAEAMRAGINAGVVGDLLTTLGSTVAQDKAMIEEAGLEF